MVSMRNLAVGKKVIWLKFLHVEEFPFRVLYTIRSLTILYLRGRAV